MTTPRVSRSARVAGLVLLLSVGLAACSGGTSPSASRAHASATTTVAPTTTTTTLAGVQALVNKLYYDESQAFQNNGAAAGELAIYNSDYPRSVNQSLFLTCEGTGRKFTQSEVPILSTLQLDPNWVPAGASASMPYWIAESTPPAGKTYILQVTSTDPSGTSTNLVHVTILDGRAYFYEGPTC